MDQVQEVAKEGGDGVDRTKKMDTGKRNCLSYHLKNLRTVKECNTKQHTKGWRGGGARNNIRKGWCVRQREFKTTPTSTCTYRFQSLTPVETLLLSRPRSCSSLQ